jgi:hypothetical protein
MNSVTCPLCSQDISLINLFTHTIHCWVETGIQQGLSEKTMHDFINDAFKKHQFGSFNETPSPLINQSLS